MVSIFDFEYKDTLEVKKGEKILPPISQRLIDWINKEYHVQVINIYFDKMISDNRPRIQIIFENNEDITKFRENGVGNYLTEKQKAISTKYIELVNELKLNDSHQIENVFVCYSEFSSLYKSNIYDVVPKNQLNELFEKYKNKLIWKIDSYGSGLIVFFHTNKEKDNSDNDFMIENLKSDYFFILKTFDEFGYLEKTWVVRESKEDFDKIYKGNWFNWSRDH